MVLFCNGRYVKPSGVSWSFVALTSGGSGPHALLGIAFPISPEAVHSSRVKQHREKLNPFLAGMQPATQQLGNMSEIFRSIPLGHDTPR
ncbi:hypothetical protein TNCT_589351 [Trichonephila clavata]|uniref:Uncharacterized protein n=1 Tax=Trichonephila clavata TaxID=2740835 RepID=A0A8X6J8Y8_TRICU|nr:hypothetical protein TNCT_589351 [Trichonephila clavata]